MNQPSKNALRNQKKRENRQDDNEKWERGVTTQPAAPVTTGVDEKEKKIRNLKKKLFQVRFVIPCTNVQPRPLP